MRRGRHDTTLYKRVEEELIQRFKKSTSMDGSIVITMKADNVPLIITPDWTFGQLKFPELANLFTVYVDVPKGRASVPYMSSDSIRGLADKILHYRGIDLEDEEGGWIRMMKLAEDYQWSYDMYEENMRDQIMAMQNPEVRQFVYEYEDGSMDFAYM